MTKSGAKKGGNVFPVAQVIEHGSRSYGFESICNETFSFTKSWLFPKNFHSSVKNEWCCLFTVSISNVNFYKQKCEYMPWSVSIKEPVCILHLILHLFCMIHLLFPGLVPEGSFQVRRLIVGGMVRKIDPKANLACHKTSSFIYST